MVIRVVTRSCLHLRSVAKLCRLHSTFWHVLKMRMDKRRGWGEKRETGEEMIATFQRGDGGSASMVTEEVERRG